MKKILALLFMCSMLNINPSLAQDARYASVNNWTDLQCYNYYKRYLAFRAGRDSRNGGFDSKMTMVVASTKSNKFKCFIAHTGSYKSAQRHDKVMMQKCHNNEWVIPSTCYLWLHADNS